MRCIAYGMRRPQFYFEDRKAAMAVFVGASHKPLQDPRDLPDSTALIRNLRRGVRLRRLQKSRQLDLRGF